MNIDTKDFADIIRVAGEHPVAATICIAGAVLIADEIFGGDITHSSKLSGLSDPSKSSKSIPQLT